MAQADVSTASSSPRRSAGSRAAPARERKLLRQRVPGAAPVRDAVLLVAGAISANVRSKPSGTKSASQPKPPEPRGAAAIAPRASPRAVTTSAPSQYAIAHTAVADRSGNASSMRASAAIARAVLEPLDESSRKPSPGPDGEAAVLDEDRTREHAVGRPRLGFDDLGRIERLRLGQVHVQPLDRETQPLGLAGLFGAARDEDDGQRLHAPILPRRNVSPRAPASRTGSCRGEPGPAGPSGRRNPAGRPRTGRGRPGRFRGP